LVGKTIKLWRGRIQTGAGKKTPVHPQTLFVDGLSWYTAKAPPDGQSDKIMEPSILIGKPEDWARSTVRGLWRIPNGPPKFAARSKLSVRPDALPCPKAWGMMTASANKLKPAQAGLAAVKMRSGRNLDSIHRAPARAVENDDAQRRSETKIQAENYQSALTLGV
jgi:hypothetical protein